MYDRICKLVSTTVAVNDCGDPIESDVSAREVYCRIVSADSKEKEQAVSRGARAELVVIMPDMIEYNGELFVDYGGRRYDVVDSKFGDTSNELRLVIGKWAQR